MFEVINTENTKYSIMYEDFEGLMPFSIIDENGEVIALFRYEDEALRVCDFLNKGF